VIAASPIRIAQVARRFPFDEISDIAPAFARNRWGRNLGVFRFPKMTLFAG
jgi:hypothetical protein